MLKNITLSADAEMIELARQKAREEKTTLNTYFRLWLKQYTQRNNDLNYKELMKKLAYAKTGRKFTRDEMNER
ncbi:hypothetical protein ACFLSQ_05580 [Bacteroidota bacterium]